MRRELVMNVEGPPGPPQPSQIGFNPRLKLRSETFVSHLLGEITEGRERAPNAHTAESIKNTLSCVLANLVKAQGQSVFVSLGKKTVYENISQRILSRTVHRMAELGWIDLRIGSLSMKYASVISRLSLDLTGLTYSSEMKESVIARKKGKQVHIETYLDQETIGRMKAEMRELNEFLAEANISWEGSEWDIPDLSNRELQRIFNPHEGINEENSGENHLGFGRMYGAFWIGMKKDRRQYLRIDGEKLALLDFNSMNVNLGYYLAGEEPPVNEDLYDLTEHLCGYDGSKQWRGAVKKFFSSIWFCTNHTMPKDIFFPKKKLKYNDVYYAILRKHPNLRKVLARRKIGYEMARLESDIMVEILLRLKGLGIVGLSIHDGLMVRQSIATEAREVMAKVSAERLGFAIPTSFKILEEPKE